MTEVVVWAVLATTVLISMFKTILRDWPSSYFGPVETFSGFVTRSPIRYLIFRFAPPFAVFLVIAVYATSPVVTVWSAFAVYAAASTLLSVRSSVLGEYQSVRLTRSRILVLATIVGGLAFCAWLALKAAPWFDRVAPPLTSILSDAIGGLIAAAIVVMYLRSAQEPDFYGYGSSRGDLDDATVAMIRAIALEHCVEPRFALAIAYVENVQRPRWFRRLERSTSRFRKQGTYGLFQVTSDRPMSDQESCRIAMERLSGSFASLDAEGFSIDDSVRRLAELHNPDRAFAEHVQVTYDNLGPDQRATNWEWDQDTGERHFREPAPGDLVAAPDERPVLSIEMIGRFASAMRARGTVWLPSDGLVEVTTIGPDKRRTEARVATIHSSGGPRATWHCDIPAETVRIEVRTTILDHPESQDYLDVLISDIEIERDLTLRS